MASADTREPSPTRSVDCTTTVPKDLFAAMLELGHLARARGQHVLVVNRDEDRKGGPARELVLFDLCVLDASQLA